jgi:hypothetical protein
VGGGRRVGVGETRESGRAGVCGWGVKKGVSGWGRGKRACV